MDLLVPGITARRVETPRLGVNVLEVAGAEGRPVVFIHGNVSSSLFFQPAMLALGEGFRPLAFDLRGYGDTDPEPIDATRGLGDWRDDIVATLDALDLAQVHLVGWSMGGGVTLQVLRDHPERVRSLTLVNPVSPFGFGGTRGQDGEITDPSGAGSGGGCANPDFVQRLAIQDTGGDDAMSPRSVLRNFYVQPPWEHPLEDIFVASMLSTRTGDDHYPGDATVVDPWPGIAPGSRGVLNTMSPLTMRLDDIDTVDPKPPILWVRGSGDQIVSDTSMFDLANLGALGAVPGWPGAEAVPPQPMVAQTRAVLDRYREAGGTVDEVVLDTGHSPHIEALEEFMEALRTVLGDA